MRFEALFTVAAMLMCSAAFGQSSPAQPTTLPSNWNAEAFQYDRSGDMVFAESTPTAGQIDYRTRPPALKIGASDPMNAGAVKPANLEGINVTHLRFTSVNGDLIPALLCTPRNQAGPFPLVIAVHGLGSYKAQVVAQIAPALTRRGFAVLAPDMPLHGERPGDPRELRDKRQLLRTAVLYQQAVVNVRECIDLAEQHPLIDSKRGVFLAGYSMGSWINSVAGPADERVKAMVLMVGGAVPLGPMSGVLPQLAAVDPMRAIAHFAGRPLLMLNAESDLTVTPEMGKRLFGAASEPKRQVWYPSGHLLPQRAYEDAAEWIGKIWSDLQRTAPHQ